MRLARAALTFLLWLLVVVVVVGAGLGLSLKLIIPCAVLGTVIALVMAHPSRDPRPMDARDVYGPKGVITQEQQHSRDVRNALDRALDREVS